MVHPDKNKHINLLLVFSDFGTKQGLGDVNVTGLLNFSVQALACDEHDNRLSKTTSTCHSSGIRPENPDTLTHIPAKPEMLLAKGHAQEIKSLAITHANAQCMCLSVCVCKYFSVTGENTKSSQLIFNTLLASEVWHRFAKPC